VRRRELEREVGLRWRRWKGDGGREERRVRRVRRMREGGSLGRGTGRVG
jgi:hypothetical protein